MTPSKKQVLPEGIYGITAEAHSNGRDNVVVVGAMIDGGVTTVQYREKHGKKSFQSMLEECRAIRRLTHDAGVLFVVNDYIELAALADADGIHVGQDDLPVADVRQRADGRLIGLSTHGPDQARAAMAAGVDYIGAGPVFATQTKEDVCDPVGLDYLNFVTREIALPAVAIGGIKATNIDHVIDRGARTVALVTEIVGADDIAAMVRQLNDRLNRARSAG